MTKRFRMISAVVAACMTLAMTAGAVNLDALADAPETETLTGTASVVTEDGVIETKFEYTVPVDATEEEKEDIAAQAAAVAAGVAPMGRAYTKSATLVSERNVEIPARGTNSVSDGAFQANNGSLEVLLNTITDCSYVTVELKTSSGSASKANVKVSYGEISVVFFYGSPKWTKDTVPVVSLSGDVDGQAGRVRVVQQYN